MSEPMIMCPRCGVMDEENIEFIKSWIWGSGRSGIEVETSIYHCKYCRKTFRKNRKIEDED